MSTTESLLASPEDDGSQNETKLMARFIRRVILCVLNSPPPCSSGFHLFSAAVPFTSYFEDTLANDLWAFAVSELDQTETMEGRRRRRRNTTRPDRRPRIMKTKRRRRKGQFLFLISSSFVNSFHSGQKNNARTRGSQMSCRPN